MNSYRYVRIRIACLRSTARFVKYVALSYFSCPPIIKSIYLIFYDFCRNTLLSFTGISVSHESILAFPINFAYLIIISAEIHLTSLMLRRPPHTRHNAPRFNIKRDDAAIKMPLISLATYDRNRQTVHTECDYHNIRNNTV